MSCVLRLIGLFAALLLVVGCDTTPQFQPDRLEGVSKKLSLDQRALVEQALVELFGTPDAPRLPTGVDEVFSFLDPEFVRQAAGPVASDEPGVTHGLYRRHCVRCHGVTGDGQGPAAICQSPYPRDFAAGAFKFKSTYRDSPPTDADLLAVLLQGVPGTAMPSYRLLLDSERKALVDYVQYLALRGEVEEALMDRVSEGDLGAPFAWDDSDSRRAFLNELIRPLAKRWVKADRQVVAVPEYISGSEPLASDEEVEAGRSLFHDVHRANCVKCHGEEGRGGVAIEEFNDRDKTLQAFIDASERLAAANEALRERIGRSPEAGRERMRAELDFTTGDLEARRKVESSLLPPDRLRPRRLAGGRLRGGSGREDLFRRIHQGLAGTPMPAVGPPTPEGEGALSDEEVSQLVAYVLTLVDRSEPTASSYAQ